MKSRIQLLVAIKLRGSNALNPTRRSSAFNFRLGPADVILKLLFCIADMQQQRSASSEKNQAAREAEKNQAAREAEAGLKALLKENEKKNDLRDRRDEAEAFIMVSEHHPALQPNDLVEENATLVAKLVHKSLQEKLKYEAEKKFQKEKEKRKVEIMESEKKKVAEERRTWQRRLSSLRADEDSQRRTHDSLQAR